MLLTRRIRFGMHGVMHLSDPGFTGALNKVIKRIQELDPGSPLGERQVYFSRHGKMIEGMILNQYQSFDGFVRQPLGVQVSRGDRSATISIPELIPDVNLFPYADAPYYRLVVSLGIVEDVMFDNGGIIKGYKPGKTTEMQIHETPWTSVLSKAPATTIELQLESEMQEGMSLILAIGVEQGRPDRLNEITREKRVGGGKVLRVF